MSTYAEADHAACVYCAEKRLIWLIKLKSRLNNTRFAFVHDEPTGNLPDVYKALHKQLQTTIAAEADYLSQLIRTDPQSLECHLQKSRSQREQQPV